MHRFLAWLAVRWTWLGGAVKGTADLVIQEGAVIREALRRNNYSEGDLREDLRSSGVLSPEQVKLAYIERSGKVSVVKAQ